MRLPYATLATPSLETNLAAQFLLEAKDRMTFLGVWPAGQPEGPTRLSGTPSFDMPPGADDLMRKDINRANGLLAIQPREVFDAFMLARSLIVNAQRAANDLRDNGYDVFATAEQLKPRLTAAFDELDAATTAVVGAKDKADAAYEAAALTFPATDESELQSVMFDAAAVAKVTPLDPASLSELRAGVMPRVFVDSRTVQALYRVPKVLHGIPDDVMQLIRDVYVSTSAPATAEAVKYLRSAVDAARSVLASAVLKLAQLQLLPSDGAFRILTHGQWLAPEVYRVGWTKMQIIDMDALAKDAAERRARPREPVATWQAPAG